MIAPVLQSKRADDGLAQLINAVASSIVGDPETSDNDAFRLLRRVDVVAWRLRRNRRVWIVAVDADDLANWVYEQRRENDRRDFMTESVCRLVIASMCDAVYMFVARTHDRLGSSSRHRHEALSDTSPGYALMRDYLAYDCGASYLLACRVALSAFRSADFRGWL